MLQEGQGPGIDFTGQTLTGNTAEGRYVGDDADSLTVVRCPLSWPTSLATDLDLMSSHVKA